MRQRRIKTTEWRMYKEFAWITPIICPPEECVEEVEQYCKAIKRYSKIKAKSLLHLGCGAGLYDYTFKKHFKVTGVDISENMLDIARRLNPEVTYLHGDMRRVRLKECFDAVAIPDSIVTPLKETRRAIMTAYRHLKPGGVLLVVDNIAAEEFKASNFVYTGNSGEIEVIIFENDYPAGTTCEVTLIYLIRRKGKLEIHTECHVMGLLKKETWLDLFNEIGFKVEDIMKLEGLYDRFIVGEGEYPLQMFVCTKPL